MAEYIPDYMRCRYCKAWFIKGPNTESHKKGKRYSHLTTCPRCGNPVNLERSFQPTPRKTNFAPRGEVEIIE